MFDELTFIFHFSEDTDISNEQAFWSAGGVLLFIGLHAILRNHNFITGFHTGMKIRTAICSVIYRKVSDFSIVANGIEINFHFFIFN